MHRQSITDLDGGPNLCYEGDNELVKERLGRVWIHDAYVEAHRFGSLNH